MKIAHVLPACMGSILLASGLAQGQNQEDCQKVRFSEEILERFPNAREACQDVISRDGQDYAVFRVWLDRVAGNTLHIRFNNPDGSRGPATRIVPQPDFRVLVNGQPTRVRDLAGRQELTAYVQVDRPMVALAPASESQPLQAVPFVLVRMAEQTGSEPTRLAAGQDDEPSMPDTASPAPLLGAAGLLLIASGLGARAIRAARSKHGAPRYSRCVMRRTTMSGPRREGNGERQTGSNGRNGIRRR